MKPPFNGAGLQYVHILRTFLGEIAKEEVFPFNTYMFYPVGFNTNRWYLIAA